MNKREESKLTAYEGVIEVIENPGDGIEITLGLTNAKNDLKLTCAEIKKKEADLKTSTIGKTDAKDVSMEELIDEAVVIAGSIYAYAYTINDIELEKFADLTERELQRSRETDVPIKVNSILEKAVELGSVLNNFGVDQASIENFRTMLQDYNSKASSKNSGFTNKTAARDDLYSLFNKAEKYKSVLEKLMLKFKKSYPDFYNRFDAANSIKDKAVRHRDNGGEEEQTQPEANLPQNP